MGSWECKKKFDTDFIGLRKEFIDVGATTVWLQRDSFATARRYRWLDNICHSDLQISSMVQSSQALAIDGIQAVLQLLILLVKTLTSDRFGRVALLIILQMKGGNVVNLPTLLTLRGYWPISDHRLAQQLFPFPRSTPRGWQVVVCLLQECGTVL